MREKEQERLPTGWESATISQLCHAVGGGTPSTMEALYWRGTIPWITSADIEGIETVYPRRWITEEAIAASATSIVPAGSVIVVTRVGLGKVALARESLCFSQDCQGLVFGRTTLDPLYLTYYLSEAVQVFKYVSRGTTIAGVTKKQLLELRIPIPPLPEQHRIVAEIEKHFTRLDAAVAALKRVQANLKRFRASVLKAACEGRLVPTEAELARAEGRNYEPADRLLARILVERRAKWEEAELAKFAKAGKSPPANWRARYQEPAAAETSGLPALPEGWAAARLDSVADVRLGRQRSPERATGNHMRPYLRAANVTWKGVDLSDVKEMDFTPPEQEVYRLCRGDILLAEASGSANEVGKPALWNDEIAECCFQNTLLRVRPFAVLTKYLHIRFQADAKLGRFGERARGVGIHHLGANGLSQWAILLPPLAEQARIVAEVERRLSVIEELEATVDTNLKRAERLRQAILKRAFEGRLVPQNPGDEPASALLERIRAERATTPDGRKARGKRAVAVAHDRAPQDGSVSLEPERAAVGDQGRNGAFPIAVPTVEQMLPMPQLRLAFGEFDAGNDNQEPRKEGQP